MIEYGIGTSRAHYWAHVCPLDAAIYWYPRRAMLSLASRSREVAIRSAIGRIVPIVPNLFANGGVIRCCEVGYQFMDRWPFVGAPTDRAAGALAEECFATACRERLFLLPVRVASRYDERSEQMKGVDYKCDLGAPHVDVEVKLDSGGGTWGTGNLFVQTHEGTLRDGDAHAVHERRGHALAAETGARADA